MPSASATRQACWPPAPPKHCKAKRVASWPLRTETCLIAFAMLATAMRMKPSATCSGVRRSPVACAISSASAAKRVRTSRAVQRLIARRAEDRREMRRLELTQAQIRVGHGERSAAPIAAGPRIGAGRIGSDAKARAVEMQNRAAARGDGVDRHHRRAHPDARDFGLERPLEAAGVECHVGGGAAHVEADDAIEPGHGGGARGADDAAGGAGQDRVLALEGMRLGEPAVRLHEIEPHACQLRLHPGDIAPQNGRQIGVHHRGVAARHQPQQRAHRVARGYLREPGRARQCRQASLMVGIAPGVHQHDRAGGDTVRARPREGVARRILVERLELGAIGTDAPGQLDHPLMQHRRQLHIEVEQSRPGLIADTQDVGESTVDHQQRALAAPLQQRVGGNRRPHLHAVHSCRDRRVGGQAEHGANTGDRGIRVGRAFG